MIKSPTSPGDVVAVKRDWLLVASGPPQETPFVFPTDPVKTAGFLIEQAGGAVQARAAVTAAAKLNGKRKGGRPAEGNDEFWLCIAANLQHRRKLQAETGDALALIRWNKVKTKDGAISELANERFTHDAPEEMETFKRRLLRKLGKRQLSDLVTEHVDVKFFRHTKPPR